MPDTVRPAGELCGHKKLICDSNNLGTSNIRGAEGLEILPAADNDSEKRWFVMRFLYNDRPELRGQFAAAGIETFYPMREDVRIRNGRREKILQPVIRDLFFVRASRAELDPYVRRDRYFQYRYRTGGRYCEPTVVPDMQMNVFMEAVRSSSKPLYFKPGELDAAKGTRIRLIGGTMHGFEGILLKVKGSREKRLIVEIPNALVVAVEVRPELVEILK